jgi:anti-sigma regulatory factor (Ser/Thr protein kinase)
VDRLILAVNEAAMNIIQHAYNYDSKGKIRLEIMRKENELIFRLTDFACPIDRSCVKSRDLKDIRPGGLGVHFINEIMDEVRFQDDCKQAGNILLMRKSLDEFCLSKKGDKQ